MDPDRGTGARESTAGSGAGAWPTTLAALAAGLLALAVLFRETFLSMVEKWLHSQTYAHGFLIIPISCYLVWARRRDVARLAPAPNPRWLAALAALAVVWLLGWAANAAVVEQLAVILMVPALVAALAGDRIARALAFPLGYLLFAVPIGDELVPPLTEFTARFTLGALGAIGVPVTREGYFLHVPGQTWEVTKACSGVRYLIASLAVGCLFAYVQFRSLRLRLAFVSLSIVVPIAANGARAVGIVLLGYLTAGRVATGVDHIIYGWFFFALVMLLLFWFGTRWREPERAREPEGPPPPAAPAPGGTSRTSWVAAAAIAIPIAAGFASHALDRRADARAYGLPDHAPAAAAGWSGPLATEDDWRPRFENPAAEVREVYWKGVDRVEFYAAYYGRQRQGAELISSMNRVYELRSGWRRTADERIREIPVDGRPFRLIETDLVRSAVGGNRRRLSWQWYVVAGTPTTNPYTAKLLEAMALFSGKREPSVAIAIAADYVSRPEDARRVLEEFLLGNEAALRRAEGVGRVPGP